MIRARLCSGRPARRAVPANRPCPRIAVSRRWMHIAQEPHDLVPFTRDELCRIKATLCLLPTFKPSEAPPHTVKSETGKPIREAAILIPLMNMNGQPHVLMEVRAKEMRVHAGEVSFPGGKADKEDPSLVETALREAREELALPSENVEILGLLHPLEYSLGNRARVWPFVGFVHSLPDYSSAVRDHDPLPSLDMSTLKPSPDEVCAILPLPLSALHPTRRALHCFRMNPLKPYWKIAAGDLLHDVQHPSLEFGDSEDAKGQLEVWGLSGWFLNRLSWAVGWMGRPEVAPPED